MIEYPGRRIFLEDKGNPAESRFLTDIEKVEIVESWVKKKQTSHLLKIAWKIRKHDLDNFEIQKEEQFKHAILGGDRNFDPAGLCVAMSMLLPREEMVLRYRFGINCGSLTLDETAITMRLSRERIHQIEARAIRTMRHPKRRRLFEL